MFFDDIKIPDSLDEYLLILSDKMRIPDVFLSCEGLQTFQAIKRGFPLNLVKRTAALDDIRRLAEEITACRVNGIEIAESDIRNNAWVNLDTRNIYIQKRFFRRRRLSVIIALVMHEAAHLLIKDNIKICTLQQAYIDKFGKNPDIMPCAPEEYYANLLSLAVFNQVEKCKAFRLYASILAKRNKKHTLQKLAKVSGRI